MASKFYTICDKKIEEECQALLYEFKEELKLFLSLFMDFMEYCAGAIEDLWVLATRLLTITNACPDIHYYPLQMTVEVKGEITYEINKTYYNIRDKIMEVIRGQRVLKEKFSALEVLSMKLNWELDTPLINGSARQLSLDYYLDKGSDMIFEFHKYLINIKLLVRSLDLRSPEEIFAFKEAIPIKKEVLHLVDTYLRYSKCVSPRYSLDT